MDPNPFCDRFERYKLDAYEMLGNASIMYAFHNATASGSLERIRLREKSVIESECSREGIQRGTCRIYCSVSTFLSNTCEM
jgi:hypothetical protein